MKKISLLFAIALTTLATLARPIRGNSAASETSHTDSHSLPYDAEVAYIEQNGGGFIGYPNLDTGFPMADIRHLYLVCDWSNHDTTYREMVGGGLSGSYFIEVNASGYYGLGYNNWSSFIATGIDELDWYYTPGAKPQLFVNGVLGCIDTLVRVPNSTFQTSLSPVNAAHIRLYRITIYTDGGEIGQDLIPVRFTNDFGLSEGAMYDTISGNLITNSGSGQFIIGPDKE